MTEKTWMDEFKESLPFLFAEPVVMARPSYVLNTLRSLFDSAKTSIHKDVFIIKDDILNKPISELEDPIKRNNGKIFPEWLEKDRNSIVYSMYYLSYFFYGGGSAYQISKDILGEKNTNELLLNMALFWNGVEHRSIMNQLYSVIYASNLYPDFPVSILKKSFYAVQDKYFGLHDQEIVLDVAFSSSNLNNQNFNDDVERFIFKNQSNPVLMRKKISHGYREMIKRKDVYVKDFNQEEKIIAKWRKMVEQHFYFQFLPDFETARLLFLDEQIPLLFDYIEKNDYDRHKEYKRYFTPLINHFRSCVKNNHSTYPDRWDIEDKEKTSELMLYLLDMVQDKYPTNRSMMVAATDCMGENGVHLFLYHISFLLAEMGSSAGILQNLVYTARMNKDFDGSVLKWFFDNLKDKLYFSGGPEFMSKASMMEIGLQAAIRLNDTCFMDEVKVFVDNYRQEMRLSKEVSPLRDPVVTKSVLSLLCDQLAKRKEFIKENNIENLNETQFDWASTMKLACPAVFISGAQNNIIPYSINKLSNLLSFIYENKKYDSTGAIKEIFEGRLSAVHQIYLTYMDKGESKPLSEWEKKDQYEMHGITCYLLDLMHNDANSVNSMLAAAEDFFHSPDDVNLLLFNWSLLAAKMGYIYAEMYSMIYYLRGHDRCFSGNTLKSAFHYFKNKNSSISNKLYDEGVMELGLHAAKKLDDRNIKDEVYELVRKKEVIIPEHLKRLYVETIFEIEYDTYKEIRLDGENRLPNGYTATEAMIHEIEQFDKGATLDLSKNDYEDSYDSTEVQAAIQREIAKLKSSYHSNDGTSKDMVTDQSKIILKSMEPSNEFRRYERLLKPIALKSWSDHEWANTLRDEFPWMTEIVDAIERQQMMAHYLGVKHCALRPLLIVGPVGVGKTHFFSRLSELMELPTAFVSLSGSSDNMMLKGSSRGWSSARPGLLVSKMLEHETANPIVILDEIDKVSDSRHNGRVWETLLTMLEPSSSSKIMDECLLGEVDYSSINWMATANYLDHVPPALLSRWTVVHAQSPKPAHFPIIFENIKQQVAKSFGRSVDDLPVLDRAIEAEIRKQFTKNTSSLRKIRQLVYRLMEIQVQAEEQKSPKKILH